MTVEADHKKNFRDRVVVYIPRILNALILSALAAFSFQRIFMNLLGVPFEWWSILVLMIIPALCAGLGTFLVYDNESFLGRKKKKHKELKESEALKEAAWIGVLASGLKALIAGFAVYALLSDLVPIHGWIILVILCSATILLIQSTELVDQAKILAKEIQDLCKAIKHFFQKKLFIKMKNFFHQFRSRVHYVWSSLTWSNFKNIGPKVAKKVGKYALVVGQALGQAGAIVMVLVQLLSGVVDPASLVIFCVASAILVGSTTGRFYGWAFLASDSEKRKKGLYFDWKQLGSVRHPKWKPIGGLIVAHASTIAKGALAFLGGLAIVAFLFHMGALSELSMSSFSPIALTFATFLGLSTWWVQGSRAFPKFVNKWGDLGKSSELEKKDADDQSELKVLLPNLEQGTSEKRAF